MVIETASFFRVGVGENHVRGRGATSKRGDSGADSCCEWYGFTSMGSWCCSTEWVWNLRTKLCCINSQESEVSAVYQHRDLILGL